MSAAVRSLSGFQAPAVLRGPSAAGASVNGHDLHCPRCCCWGIYQRDYSLAKDGFIDSAAGLAKTRLLSYLETFSTTGPTRNNNLRRPTRFNQFLGEET